MSVHGVQSGKANGTMLKAVESWNVYEYEGFAPIQ